MPIEIDKYTEEFANSIDGKLPSYCDILQQSGSSRRYFRLHYEDATVILCVSDNISENQTFVNLSRFLKDEGIAVPQILYVSQDRRAYFQTDLGANDLFSLISESRNASGSLTPEVMLLIENAVDQLVKFQQLPTESWENKVEFPPLGKELIEYDLQYALNNFFDVSGVEYNRTALVEELKRLSNCILDYPERYKGLMYRDFQSRNVMVVTSSGSLKKNIYFIDYQSARKGAGIYDLVSFAWQAKASFNSDERKKITDSYIDKLERRGYEDARQVISENLPFWCVFRIMQTLGAYGLRGIKEKKPHFIASIPYALHNLFEILGDGNLMIKFPVLRELVNNNIKKFK